MSAKKSETSTMPRDDNGVTGSNLQWRVGGAPLEMLPVTWGRPETVLTGHRYRLPPACARWASKLTDSQFCTRRGVRSSATRQLASLHGPGRRLKSQAFQRRPPHGVGQSPLRRRRARAYPWMTGQSVSDAESRGGVRHSNEKLVAVGRHTHHGPSVDVSLFSWSEEEGAAGGWHTSRRVP